MAYNKYVMIKFLLQLFTNEHPYARYHYMDYLAMDSDENIKVFMGIRM